MSGARPPSSGRVARGLWSGTRLALSGSLLLLFLVPLVVLVLYAPLGELLQVARDPGVEASLGFTLYASGLALGLSLALGIPMGHLLARRAFRGKTLVESAVALPVVVPHLVAGLALFLAVRPGSPIGAALSRAGLPVFDTIWGVVLVMVYVSSPYTVLAAELSFRAVDPRLLEAARSLGASPAVAARTVALPLALRGLVAGGLLTWARSVSEIGGFLILAYTVYPSTGYAGPVTNPLSVYIYTTYSIDLSAAAATASLFLLIAFGLFLAVRLIERTGRLPWRTGELPL
ncbi:MAG TPA: ABC transporter permease [Thermoplasmata archaeon]|nr:ABC transporter permease [Thermoplasmata archaeon]